MKNSEFVSVCKKLVRKGDEFLAHQDRGFHTRAAELLGHANLAELYDYSELVEYSFRGQFRPAQNFTASEFSNLPLTVVRGERCFIDVYFWRRNPTTIHNHHFTGAFQCLRGKNIDTEFSFRKVQKLTRLHALGDLVEHQTREVRPGDVQAIDLQDKFIHQNHHHGELTVNLCFRTPDAPGKNLANFLYSGLRFEKDRAALIRAKRLYDFSLIDAVEPRKLDLTLTDAVDFILNTHGTGSSHPRVLGLQKFLHAKVKRETGVDLFKLLGSHQKRLEEIELLYE